MEKKSIYAGMLAVTVMLMASCGSGPGEKKESAADSEPAGGEKVTLRVDVDKSLLNWRGEMLGIYAHYGTVPVSSASLVMEGDRIKEGSFVVDLTGITPLDDNYNEDRPKENLVGHLQSADFFDVENHPEATFVITEVDGSDISGMMTIRGETHPETFEGVSVAQSGNSYTITGKTVIDRKKYNVSFDMTVPDMVLSDDIQLDFNLVAGV